MNYGTLGRSWNFDVKAWRAGSGDGSRNRCYVNHGPIPQNDYTILDHEDHANDIISGRRWHVNDTRCDRFDNLSNMRTQLFIHTEETYTQGQYCPTAGDDPYCWEGTNDYYSEGCVKVNHSTAIADVDSDWHAGTNASPTLTVDA